jgi:hypothetical protein
MNDRKEYTFYIGRNIHPTEQEKKNYPKEDYPIAMGIYLGNEEDLIQVKGRLAKIPKEKVKYRQYQGYCKNGLEIYAACVESVKHILFDQESPINGAALIERASKDEQILPYQILDKARKIVEEPKIDIQKPQTGRKR